MPSSSPGTSRPPPGRMAPSRSRECPHFDPAVRFFNRCAGMCWVWPRRSTTRATISPGPMMPESPQAAREGTITGFVKRSYGAIQPTGARRALDVFGIVALCDNDRGIGRRLSASAPYADDLCLMVHPSHLFEGDRQHPVGTGARERLPCGDDHREPGAGRRDRPAARRQVSAVVAGFHPAIGGVLSLRAGPDPGPPIDAAGAFGVRGWLLCNPVNGPAVEALEPE